MPDPILCTETVNPNYTIGTFTLFLQPSGGVERSVGNIQTGSFQFTPQLFEHRRGIDNSLDDILNIGSDYIINATGDEITADNLGAFLNETPANAVDGCRIPLTGSRCVRYYGARLVHFFPCQTKSVEIILWRTIILADTTLNFDATANAAFPLLIRALSCASIHPAEPYGRITFSEACPAS